MEAVHSTALTRLCLSRAAPGGRTMRWRTPRRGGTGPTTAGARMRRRSAAASSARAGRSSAATAARGAGDTLVLPWLAACWQERSLCCGGGRWRLYGLLNSVAYGQLLGSSHASLQLRQQGDHASVTRFFDRPVGGMSRALLVSSLAAEVLPGRLSLWACERCTGTCSRQ